MINIHPSGRLGNLMFQYALARIIAEQKDYATDLELPFKNATMSRGKAIKSPVEKLTGHYVDLKGILEDKSNRRIFLHGFFQQIELYTYHKDKIRTWFAIDDRFRKPDDNDLVMHVRGGDLYNKNGNAQHTPCPYSYYKNIIDETKYDKLYIVTEREDDLVVQRIAKDYDLTVISQTIMEDYYFMYHAKKLVLSVCTIAWWAGWLGKAEVVHFPMIGYWHPKSERNEIKLQVNETRYEYHDLGVQDNWSASDEQIKELLR